jgi:cation transport ATPase
VYFMLASKVNAMPASIAARSAMAASSISVIANALRLRSTKV